MSSIKERMAEVIQEQPEDATYEEIMRELAFHRMILSGSGGLTCWPRDPQR